MDYYVSYALLLRSSIEERSIAACNHGRARCSIRSVRGSDPRLLHSSPLAQRNEKEPQRHDERDGDELGHGAEYDGYDDGGRFCARNEFERRSTVWQYLVVGLEPRNGEVRRIHTQRGEKVHRPRGVQTLITKLEVDWGEASVDLEANIE